MSDPGSVTQQIVRHRHAVAAFLYAIVPDVHAVEDLFQEVSLVAIQKAAEYQDGTNFIAWIRAIARNKLREHLRKRNGVSFDDAFFDGLDRAFDEARSATDPDRRKEALRRCLDELQEGSRELLALRYEAGLSPAAIAARVGRTRIAVNSLLQRIREVLKDCVDRCSAEARA